MNRSNHPDTWKTPQWHPDLGDANSELLHLQDVAKATLQLVPRLGVRLELPEPGLMYVSVWDQNRRVAELYSKEGIGSVSPRKYALFLLPDTPDEEEHYCDSPVEIVNLLMKLPPSP